MLGTPALAWVTIIEIKKQDLTPHPTVQPSPLRRGGQIRYVAAPGVSVESPHQPGPQWIAVDISDHIRQVRVRLYENGLVTA